MGVCMYVCMHACTYVNMCIHNVKGKLTGVSGTKIRVDVLVCMCVYMYVCMYVCTCVYMM